MSGGIAYLYSPDGTFDEKKFNLEMVELEDLTIESRNRSWFVGQPQRLYL